MGLVRERHMACLSLSQPLRGMAPMAGMQDEWGPEVPLEKKIDDLYAIVADVEIAMLTTRRPDGMLVTRPMATQKRHGFADFWFVTDIRTEKIDELAADPHVSLAYYNSKSWEWVSASGRARVVRDRRIIEELYRPDWKAWFEDEGGEMDGGPTDPRFALLAIDADSVIYGKRRRAKPFALFEIAKGIATGKQPDVQDIRKVSGDELS
jgi:general stress protein 26